MRKSAYNVLRVGTAITFLWIGILIFREPNAWAGFVNPWVLKIVPLSVHQIVITTAIFDIMLGALLLLDTLVWLAALFGAMHMITILLVSGINEITVRDIAILSATLALFLESIPPGSIALWCRKEVKHIFKPPTP